MNLSICYSTCYVWYLVNKLWNKFNKKFFPYGKKLLHDPLYIYDIYERVCFIIVRTMYVTWFLDLYINIFWLLLIHVQNLSNPNIIRYSSLYKILKWNRPRCRMIDVNWMYANINTYTSQRQTDNEDISHTRTICSLWV